MALSGQPRPEPSRAVPQSTLSVTNLLYESIPNKLNEQNASIFNSARHQDSMQPIVVARWRR
jgi:hypothetical protein